MGNLSSKLKRGKKNEKDQQSVPSGKDGKDGGSEMPSGSQLDQGKVKGQREGEDAKLERENKARTGADIPSSKSATDTSKSADTESLTAYGSGGKGILIMDKSRVQPTSLKAQFDEENLKKTYHPKDKDYGHIQISEPPTPFHQNEDPQENAGLDFESLMKRLEQHEKAQETDAAEDRSEDFLQKRNHEKFVTRRMEHYGNEFKAAKAMSGGEDVRESETVKRNTEFNRKLS